MRKVMFAFALVGAFLAGSLLSEGMRSQAQDKTEPKARGQLYPKWKMLGLTEEQIQKIYRIQTDYRAKIEGLEEQIKKLKAEELSKAKEVLTPAQKARLQELLLGEPEKDKTTSPKDKTSDK